MNNSIGMSQPFKKIKAGHYENNTFMIVHRDGMWSFARLDSGMSYDRLSLSIHMGRVHWDTFKEIKEFLLK